MDTIAETAIETLIFNSGTTMSSSFLDKHFYRKHGKDTYYEK